jgi:hypothetical protein
MWIEAGLVWGRELYFDADGWGTEIVTFFSI